MSYTPFNPGDPNLIFDLLIGFMKNAPASTEAEMLAYANSVGASATLTPLLVTSFYNEAHTLGIISAPGTYIKIRDWTNDPNTGIGAIEVVVAKIKRSPLWAYVIDRDEWMRISDELYVDVTPKVTALDSLLATPGNLTALELEAFTFLRQAKETKRASLEYRLGRLRSSLDKQEITLGLV